MFIKILKILFIIFIFLYLTFVNNHVYAEINTDLSNLGEIPGVTCGDASNENISQCCNTTENTEINANSQRFFCIPFGGPCASDLPNSALNSFISSDLDKVKDDLVNLANENGGCVVGDPEDTGQGNCKCIKNSLETLCLRYIKDINEQVDCEQCVTNGNGIWTGLGCIGLNFQSFISSILSISLGLAGGIAFLCIIFSAIMFQTSSGNPERIKKARMYLTNCIVGLLLIIFSVFILRLIGVTILKIPGWT